MDINEEIETAYESRNFSEIERIYDEFLVNKHVIVNEYSFISILEVLSRKNRFEDITNLTGKYAYGFGGKGKTKWFKQRVLGYYLTATIGSDNIVELWTYRLWILRIIARKYIDPMIEEATSVIMGVLEKYYRSFSTFFFAILLVSALSSLFIQDIVPAGVEIFLYIFTIIELIFIRNKKFSYNISFWVFGLLLFIKFIYGYFYWGLQRPLLVVVKNRVLGRVPNYHLCVEKL